MNTQDLAAALSAAGDGWLAVAESHGLLVLSHNDEHLRDAVHTGREALYRNEHMGRWYVQCRSQTRLRYRRTPLSKQKK